MPWTHPIQPVTKSFELTVIEQAGDWRDWSGDAEHIVATVFKVSQHSPDDKAIALVLSDDAQIRQMNRDFRGKDKPTNVLSFPSDAPDEWGDIIVSEETIRKEAAEQGKTFHDHFVHMLVHGTLHLLGYDHEIEAEAEEMEALEIDILSELGVENPYENG